MKKYFAVLAVILALAIPCEGSLRALPEVKGPSAAIHSGEFGALMKRLGESYFFETFMLENPAGPDLARWLSGLPVESFSMLVDSKGSRGAIVLDSSDGEVQRVFGRMEDGGEADEELLASLLRYPADAPKEAVRFSLDLEDGGRKVYRLGIRVEGMPFPYPGSVDLLVTVKRDGEGLYMLFGEDEETLAEAEAAFGDPGKRLKAEWPPAKTFVRLLGDEEGEVTAAVFEELGFKAPAFRSPPSMELCLEAGPGKFALTLRHNFLESILGSTGGSVPAPSLGEGAPFLAAGSLTTEALDRTPALPPLSAVPGAETLFFARLDAGRVLKVAEEAMAGSWGLKLLETAGMDINSMSDVESLISIPRAVRELKGLTLTVRPDSISLEAETGDVDYKAIHDFENLVRRRFSAAFTDASRPYAGDVPPGIAAEAEALAAAAEAKVLAVPVQSAPDPDNPPDALAFDGPPAGPEAAEQPAPEPKPTTTVAPAPAALQPGPPAVPGKKFSAGELKKMGVFLSNFTELRFMNINAEEFTDPDDPGDMIRFGIGHNYVNNFKSRIVRCKTKNCQWGSMTIDGKFVAESIKKYFDYDYKNVPGEFYGDQVYYYDGSFYHFDGFNGGAVYFARVDEAYVDVNGRVVMKGEIYNHGDKSEIIGKFTALARPHKFGGKDTWALITLETEFY